jgi:thiosulfate/3-mercaptopyruvate sulfurtransferase
MVLTGRVTAADHPLVDVPTMAARLTQAARPTVLDVRWRLRPPGTAPAGPGRESASGWGDYAAGHLPGAVFVDLDSQLCGPPGEGGRHPLPDPAALQRELRAAGIRAGHPVVVYDSGEGQAAARTWWTLRWAGIPDVRVLDGGYAAWVAAGHPTTSEVPDPPAGNIVVRPGSMPVLDAESAAGLARDGVLIDVRVAPRYLGETEPIDPVAGHIPGAANLPTGGHAGPDGRFRPAEELRAGFAGAGVADGVRVGAYCGSGVAAAHTVLALHLAGRTDAALYVGSWSHWITDPARPVVTGAEGQRP